MRQLFVPGEHAAMVHGFAEAIEIGWFTPIPHGFCYYCDRETIVYDIHVGPAQPPKCIGCFISSMVACVEQSDDDVTGSADTLEPPAGDGIR